MRTALGFLSLLAILVLISVPSGSAQTDRMTALEHRVRDLELGAMVMGGEINQLKTDRDVDSDSIQGIQDEVDDLRKDVDDGTMKTGKVRSDLDDLTKRVAALEERTK